MLVGVAGVSLLCLVVATAGARFSTHRLSLALVVGWSAYLGLIWCSTIALAWRWRLAHTNAGGWFAAGSMCGAIYVTSCTLRLYAGHRAGSPMSAFEEFDVVMVALWLFLARRAIVRPDSLPQSGPIWLGIVVGTIGACVQTTLAALGFDGSGWMADALARIVLSVWGLLAVIAVTRVRGLSRPMRVQLLAICVFGATSRIAAPADPSQASTWGVVSLVAGVAAASVLLRIALSLFFQDRVRVEAVRELAGVTLGGATASEQIHEVRASFAGIASAVRLLTQHKEDLPRARRDDVSWMLAGELDRIERLLNGKPVASVPDVDLDAVLRSIVMARRLAGQQVDWEPSGCRVEGSPDLIGTAVNTLLVNASVHAPGSSVHLRAAQEGSVVRMSVTDDGPGVPTSVHRHLFRRGVRDHASPGHGIGLHFARRLAKAQGGSLELAAGHPGNTTFELTLPATNQGDHR
ncbi:sensor histidine kinase [Nocardioides maradonensis]